MTSQYTHGVISASTVYSSVVGSGFRDFTQEAIDRIDYELALEELSRLTEVEGSEVAEYERHAHWDKYHGPNSFGIYGCCIMPRDPRKP